MSFFLKMKEELVFVGKYRSDQGDFYFFGNHRRIEGKPFFSNGDIGCKMLGSAPVLSVDALAGGYLVGPTLEGTPVVNWNEDVDKAFCDDLELSVYFKNGKIQPLTERELRHIKSRNPNLDLN